MHIENSELLYKGKSTKYFRLKCFGSSYNTGNIAIVVNNDNSSINDRLKFSQENQVACVFTNPASQANSLILDFYYPHSRSALCLHATLAAGYIYFASNTNISKVSVLTSMHQQQIQLIKQQDNVFIVLEQQVSPTIEKPALIHNLLNISSSDIIGIPVIASVGSPKLLIEVPNLDILNSITPNLNEIHEWSHNNQINGFYVYTHLNDNNYIGRNFNHVNSKLEDSATGVAAGALTAHLKQNINLFQGANINNPCVMSTKIIDNKIFIGGTITYAL